jgi:hypothetical protein
LRKDLTTEPPSDYYQLLGVARDATEQEIKSAPAGTGSIAHCFVDDPPLPVNDWPDDFVKYLKYRK